MIVGETRHTTFADLIKAVVIVCGVACSILPAAPAHGRILYASGFDGVFFELDPDTGVASNIQTFAGSNVNIYTLATQPGTHQLFVLRNVGDILATVDPSSGSLTNVVTLNTEWIAGITYAPDGTLYGVTARDNDDFRGPNVGGAIVIINMTTGVVTDTGFASDGQGGGHSLDYNPDDGLLYHFYNTGTGGGGTSNLETVDPLTGTVTQVPLSGHSYGAVNAVVYAGDTTFFAYDKNAANLMEVTTDGVVTLLSNVADPSVDRILGLALDAYAVAVPASDRSALFFLVALFILGLALLPFWRRSAPRLA